MRRAAVWLLVMVVVAAATLAYSHYGEALLAKARPPIRVGILHSLTGASAISESSMIDAEKLAVEEINAKGGLNGRRLE